MTDFEWTNAIEIGHAEIDAQHRRLLQLCTAVIEPLVNSAAVEPDAVQLQALIDYAEGHFAFEESLMRQAAYPGTEWHAKHHAALLAEFRTYFDKAQRGERTNPVGLMSFLWTWLNLHIDAADRELVAWLASRESGAGG